MNEKYTIGELAKDAGITTKAIRIYEKKGLLKPIAYSECNYRLYDNNAKIILQKIMTLKFVGFSLDEIGELMEKDKDNNILESLSYQKRLLELKRDQIDRVIDCVDRAAKRCAEGEMDWNSFTDIMRSVIIDRKADEGYWTSLKYSINKEDWHEKIYNNLCIGPDETILDIGCGYGTMWRNCWDRIPHNVKVTLMDLHGTWADDFAEFIKENSSSLQEKTNFRFVWGNVENENSFNGKYDHIIACYLFRFIKEPEKLINKIKEALSGRGIFHCINRGNTIFLENIATLLKGFDGSLHSIDDKISKVKAQDEVFERQLNSIFSNVEIKVLDSAVLGFESASEFYEYMIKRDFVSEYNLDKRKKEFEDYFSGVIEKKGKIIIPSQACLYCCR